jgi:hypothetical protein
MCEPADSLEISPLEGHSRAATALQEQAGGPDFDADRIDLARLDLLNLVMRVVRPPLFGDSLRLFQPRNPRSCVGKFARLGNTVGKSALETPNHRASVAPY